MDEAGGSAFQPGPNTCSKKVSSVFLLLLGTAWALFIAATRAAGDKVNIVTPATAAFAGGLGRAVAPTAARVLDRLNSAVVARIERSTPAKEDTRLAEHFRSRDVLTTIGPTCRRDTS